MRLLLFCGPVSAAGASAGAAASGAGARLSGVGALSAFGSGRRISVTDISDSLRKTIFGQQIALHAQQRVERGFERRSADALGHELQALGAIFVNLREHRLRRIGEMQPFDATI